MEIKAKVANKKCYILPKIEQVMLDNEIALALESLPPAGPAEVYLTPEYMRNDPYRNTNS